MPPISTPKSRTKYIHLISFRHVHSKMGMGTFHSVPLLWTAYTLLVIFNSKFPFFNVKNNSSHYFSRDENYIQNKISNTLNLSIPTCQPNYISMFYLRQKEKPINIVNDKIPSDLCLGGSWLLNAANESISTLFKNAIYQNINIPVGPHLN